MYKLNNIFDLIYVEEENKLYLKGLYGYYYLYLSKEIYIKTNKDLIKIMLISKNKFFSILNNFLVLYKRLFKLFFFRIKLKGLGFRLKKLNKKLYKIFMAYNHSYYWHSQKKILIKKKGKKLLIISNNKECLNDLYIHLLIFEKIDKYIRKSRFLSLNKIMYLKKKKYV